MIGNKVKNRNIVSLRQTKHRTQHFRVLSILRESLTSVSRILFIEYELTFCVSVLIENKEEEYFL